MEERECQFKSKATMIPLTLLLVCLSALSCSESTKYSPDWKSLDSRPLPKWYDDAKFGIFLHWGVYSVPSYGSEWFWQFWKTPRLDYVQFMRKNYKPNFSYQDFAKDFTTEFYDAAKWSKIFEASGAKYVVLTSKHHEGYALWPSKYSYSWNSQDVGPHKDLIGELATAIRKNTNIKFGLYYSLFEWFNPLWLQDKKNDFKTDVYVRSKAMPQLKELIETYEPEVVWSDGDADGSEDYWKSKEFLAWLYNESPVKETVVTNDRWGTNVACKHGDFYTCADRYNPGVLLKHKWENCMTVDKKSWGYRRNAPLEDYMSTQDLVKELITTVSCGGNLLLNVGPTKDGMIAPIFEERLRGIGEWLETNGDAIYESKPWRVQNDTLTGDVWYTVGRDSNLYASMLTWPEDDILRLESVKVFPETTVKVLGSSEKVSMKKENDHLAIKLPQSAHKGRPAWVLQFTHYE